MAYSEPTADAVSHDLRGTMKTIPDFAMEIMSRSSAPALPLPRLVDAIAEETAGLVADAERILREIRMRPDLFRVLDPFIGPWRRATARPGETPPVHFHPDRVLVSLNRCVDNASQEARYEAGAVSWEPAITHGGQTITSVNDCVFVEVELKSPTGR